MRIDDTSFVDEQGRKLMLRGINLGGSSKVPKRPDGATHISEGFYQHEDVSFIGRPFPLSESDEHYTRLREWGFNFIRFLVTWEAIEHKGPARYDHEYLDYISRVLEKAGEYGFHVFIDPHQDVWSRFSGGDGAPGWTLEKMGFDMQHFAQTGAAITHQAYGQNLPWFTWPTNMDKLACATMFTLFFAGNDFAPKTKIEGEPVQEYLQRHYIQAIEQIAQHVSGLKHVIGFDTMNEPTTGYIGLNDLSKVGAILRKAAVPTPWQSILLGSGFPQEVDIWDGFPRFRRIGKQWLNAERINVWKQGYECVWKQNGVWDIGINSEPRLLQPAYFHQVNGRTVNFHRDYCIPFAMRYKEAIRKVNPSALIFLESFPGNVSMAGEAIMEEGMVYAPHWYDISTLALKKYNPLVAFDTWHRRVVLFPHFIRRSFAEQLYLYQLQASEQMGGLPMVLGETGIPFDMKEGRSFISGDFSAQERAFDRCLRAVEDNFMNVTIWNYTADNDNIHGDQWNGEDFSIYSTDQRVNISDIYSGGRALRAIIRPYPEAVAGNPQNLSFDMKKHVFKFSFKQNPAILAPTEIFVPRYHYHDDYRVSVSDGKWEKDIEHQKLLYWHTNEREIHTINIEP